MKKLYDNRHGAMACIFTLCLILFSCIPEGIELPSRVRAVVTDSVTNVTYCRANVCGVVSVIDTDTITSGVIYSTQSSLSSKSGTKKSIAANGKYAVALDQLKANTTYYYRAYAIDAGVYKYGEVLSFSTPEAPSVTTGEASAITHCEATLSGVLRNSEKSITCGFIYGTSSTPSLTNDAKVDTLSQGAYTIKITNLKAATTYYYRAYAIVDDECMYGEVLSFTTAVVAEAVDLGLSVKWASCNVGATSPEEYGDYFAWGETKTKSNYTESNSVTRGIIDADGNLTAEYDAATVNWGSSWRMPTLDEMNELVNNCTWKWATQNGVIGYKVTGPSGNSIFLPAAGWRDNTSLHGAGSFGYYWSATPLSGSYYACLDFGSDHYDWSNGLRSSGRTVRPVFGEPSQVVSISITTGEVSDITANGATLSGTVSGADQAVVCGVIYGTSLTLSSTSGTAVTANSQGEYSVSIATLEANTTYYYRAFVLVDGEYKYGDVKSFTTLGYYVEIPEGAVDLGLSVKWAPWNVGATSPEDYGDYFAWGETKSKSSYSISNSVTYGLSISELKSRGIIGADGNLTAAYDVATENWGDEWRMPTLDEIKELINQCTWKWTTQNGVNGYKVTGPNGNSIFLPTVGFRYDTSLSSQVGSGCYLSASPYSSSDYAYAYGLFFDVGNYYRHYYHRYYGRAVRPVFGEPSQKITISITTDEATDITAEGATLNGTVSGADQAVDCGFICDTSSTPSSMSGIVVTTNSQGEYSVSIANLADNTTYYYCAYVVVDGEYVYGEVLSFTTLDDYVEIPEGAVDLGLSVYWASCNVGAESPEEYGDYFAWGETSPKSSYAESTSATYGLSISELESRGIIGSDGNLTAEYDAATANWGVSWRMPTFDEMKELFNKCTWEWTTQNGVYGRKVTGPSGNSIFLPAAGGRNGAWLSNASSHGLYWSATPSSDSGYACDLDFDSGYYYCDFSIRSIGRTVRPVFDEPSQGINISVTTGEATDITTNGATLSGVVSGADQAVDCGIIYGTSSTLSSTSGTAVTANSQGEYSVTVADLEANTTYYYCAYVVVDGEYKYGDVKFFTTLDDYVELPEGAVDLGLSVYWASCNVGAESPEEYGDYFAWGETTTKSSYSSSTSVTYGLSISELESRGIIGANGNLTAAYDAATANWGDNWRMPTKAEQDELRTKCDWEWTKINGVNGYKVTGPNGNSIFLPAAGYRGSTSLNNAGSYGYYWSATPYSNSNYACYFYFYLGYYDCNYYHRYYGRTVRPVSER